MIQTRAASLQEVDALHDEESDHGDHFHPNHVSVFAGLATESKEGHSDEEGFAFGGEYEFRLNQHWGVGVFAEFLGLDTVRDLIVGVPVSLHLGGNWRVFFGPALEFTLQEDEFAFRLGGGYAFRLGGGWSLSPEVVLDLIESGGTTFVGGLALGYGF